MSKRSSFHGNPPTRPSSGENRLGTRATSNPTPHPWGKWLEGIAREDQSDLSSLYDESSSLVYNTCLRILTDRDLAEEAVLDVYMHIWNHASRFDPQRGSPLAWIIMIARSRALDRKRALGRKTATHQDVSVFEEALKAPMDSAPEHQSQLRERQSQVREAVRQLPDESRDLIERAWFQGLTHQQIADATNQPLGTVKTRIRAGMLSLKQFLNHRDAVQP